MHRVSSFLSDLFGNRNAAPRRVSLAITKLENRLLLSASNSEIWDALDLPQGVGVAFSGDNAAVQQRWRFNAGGLLGFPTGRDEDFLIMSTGIASQVDTLANTSGSQGTDLGTQGEGGDTSTISFTMPVPASTRPQKFKLDFMFLSEEYPEYVGSNYNDFFRCTVNGTNIALDQGGNEVSVNNVFFTSANAPGTFFDGRTSILTATYAIPDGTNSLNVVLSVGDEGDGIYDSAAIIDNARIETSQLVFLDFDGGHPDLGDTDFDMPGFNATDLGFPAAPGAPGYKSTATVISEVVGFVEADYALYDIEFTTTKPTEGTFTTVVIGGPDTPLNANPGSILFGRAQSVDIGNRIHDDQAVVFSQEFGNFYMDVLPDGNAYHTDDPNVVEQYLATTISHELAHNLGLRHVDNAFPTNLMKKNSPRQHTSIFEDVYRSLPAVELPAWPDEAITQNDHEYLEGVLGLYDGSSTLAQGWSWLWELMTNWFSFDMAGATLYDVQIGTMDAPDYDPVTGVVEADVAPQVQKFDQLSGNTLLNLVNFTGVDKFFIVGASTPGGPLDVTSGGLDGSGNVTIEDALTDMVDGGYAPVTSFGLQQKQPGGGLAPFATVGLQETPFGDLIELDGGTGTFEDDDGDMYTIQYKGPGTVAFAMDDDDQDGKGGIGALVVSGTDAKAQVQVKVKSQKGGGGDGLVSADTITANTLKALKSKQLDLDGAGVSIAGWLGQLQVHDIVDGTPVSAGSTPDMATKVQVNDIGDGVNLTFGSNVKGLKANSYGAGGVFTAPIAGKLAFNEAVGSDIVLTGADAKGYALKAFQNKTGGMTGSFDIQAGSAGKIAIGGDFADPPVPGGAGASAFAGPTLDVAGTLKALQVKLGNLEAGIYVDGDLFKVAVQGKNGMGGNVDGAEFNVGGLFKSLSVTDQFDDTDIDANALGKIAVKGAIASSDGTHEIVAQSGSFKISDNTGSFNIDGDHSHFFAGGLRAHVDLT